MKIQATVVLTVKADSLRDAGEALDDLLLQAGERKGIRVDHVELSGPVEPVPVSIPAPAAAPAVDVPPPRRRPEPSLRA